ncbi:MAG: triose-phosphate isomerase [Candidatus Woesearchaeota archaeon]
MEIFDKKPIYVINYKAYSTSYGKKAMEIAKISEEISNKKDVNIILSVPHSELYRISKEVDFPVFSQSVSEFDDGSHTGFVTVNQIKSTGVKGSLINHSENRIRIDTIEKIIKKLKDNKLLSIVCANDEDVGSAISSLKPDVVAVEPPELIGGDISVSSAKPEVIENSVKKIININSDEIILVGAGIKSKEDVKKSMELGADGILVASKVMKAKDPKKAISDLIL